MKKDLCREIVLKEGISAQYNDNFLTVKGEKGEVKKRFDLHNISLNVLNNKIVLKSKGATRRESRNIGTVWAQINNMVKGVSEDFVYKLEICSVHFPMNVKVEGDKVIIKSFLGEKDYRTAKIMPGVKVDVSSNIITVSGNDIESAGQTAANIEKSTYLNRVDRRIFQDGIFLVEKNGREL